MKLLHFLSHHMYTGTKPCQLQEINEADKMMFGTNAKS